MEKIKLNNGILMPCIGLGVYRMDNTETSENIIKYALSNGYRHIDTASYYDNEEIVGKAIKESEVKREDIFLTTKVWNEDQRQSRVLKAFETSLKKLDTEYLDLYLIHWPVADKIEQTWEILSKLYEQGKIKAIGVSNFKQHHIERLQKCSPIVPVVNQIELHPYFNQRELVNYCLEHHIQPVAWSPLGASKTNLLEEAILKNLAKKYNKCPAQIVLRWNFQNHVVSIPKSSNKERLKQNISIFDFELTKDEMLQIDSLNSNKRLGADPDTFDF